MTSNELLFIGLLIRLLEQRGNFTNFEVYIKNCIWVLSQNKKKVLKLAIGKGVMVCNHLRFKVGLDN